MKQLEIPETHRINEGNIALQNLVQNPFQNRWEVNIKMGNY